MSSRGSPTGPDRCPSTPCCGRGPRASGVAGEGFTAVAAALVVVALLGGIVLATGVLGTAPPPVDRPNPPNPIEIEGISGDGGLRLEKDLAIGRASVAIVNDTGAFVVTADDGVAHRLALPGFDAPLNARTAARRVSICPRCCRCRPTAPSSSTPGTALRADGEAASSGAGSRGRLGRKRRPAAGPHHRCPRHLPVPTG